MSPPLRSTGPSTGPSRLLFGWALGGALALVLGIVVLVAVLDARIGAPAHRPAGRGDGAVSGPRAGTVAAVARSPTTRALLVLRAWDARRAAAYASGRPGAVRRLYVAGSSAGVADVRLAIRYRSRGLRVVGMRTQVLALRVLGQDRDHWRLAVTDRLAWARARRVGGTRGSVALPRDQPTSHVITLVRTEQGWRMATVRAVAAVS